MTEFLTVEEFASKYRTTSTTVYRWLKQGKLSGIKIGKEWRLDAQDLDLKDEQEEVSADGVSIFSRLEEKDHVLLLAQSKDKVFEAEANYFKYAYSHGKKMIKGCWWQDPDEIAERYRAYGFDTTALEKDNVFKIMDFTRLYKKFGIDGLMNAWRNELLSHDDESLWICGAPCSCIFNSEKSLLKCEINLNTILKNLNIVALCTYYSEEFHDDGFCKLSELAKIHTGLIVYETTKSVLMRS